MKENFLSIGIALLLASGIFFWLLSNFDSFSSLQTNVLWAQQETFLWDVLIQTYEDKIEVVANKDISDVEALSIMLLWNQNEVIPWFEQMSSVWRAELTQEYTSRVTVFVNWLSWVSNNDILLSLPLNWEVSQVSVSDVILLFGDDSSERASLSTR
jgi:hypothetical protein